MSRFGALRIRTRLVLSLAGIAVLLSIPLVVALASLREQRQEMERLRDREFGASVRVGRVRVALEEMRSAERRLVSRADSAAWASAESAGRRLPLMAGLLAPYGTSTDLRRFVPAVDAIARHADAGHRAAIAGNVDVAAAARDSLGRSMAAAVRGLNEAERGIQRGAEQRVARAGAQVKQALLLSSLVFLVALALASGLAMALTRSITLPVSDLKRGMEAVSEGRMDYRLSTDGARGDEFGFLAAGFTGMVERLTQLEGLRQRWLGHFSHELKNPLGVMRGTLELFDEGIHAQLTPQGQDFCGRAIQTSKLMEARILNMIEVAKFQTGHGKMEPRPMPLSAFLKDVDAAFQILAARPGINFRFARHDPLPDEVVWDEDRVREVLENLVSNAFKFTPKDGTVALDVRRVNDRVEFSVSDTGAGIPQEALPKLFNPYYQADNQRKASAKGTGLGLAIAKGIVDAHGGTITATSQVEKGTTFIVALPTAVPGPG